MPFKTPKSSSTRGYSKAKKRRLRKQMIRKYRGPITVKEIIKGTKVADKHDVNTRSFTVRTVPADANSMTVVRRFEVLIQPKRPIDVLRIKKPSDYWRAALCLLEKSA